MTKKLSDEEIYDKVRELRSKYRGNSSVQLEHSDVWLRCHLEGDCYGEYCTMHNRSDHSMRSFPQHWRDDREIMERINPFGGTCPDPDEINTDRVHGCIINPYSGTMMCSKWEINSVEAAWITTAYAVTKDGQVWSFFKTNIMRNGNSVSKDYSREPKKLVQKDNGKGYKNVTLVINGEKKTRYVHRLVLLAWKGEQPKGFAARHLDGIRSNNNLDNLEWSSMSENNMDKWGHGTMMHGESHPNSRLTKEAVLNARKLWTDGLTLDKIKDTLKLDVCKQTIHEAVTRQTWKWVN